MGDEIWTDKSPTAKKFKSQLERQTKGLKIHLPKQKELPAHLKGQYMKGAIGGMSVTQKKDYIEVGAVIRIRRNNKECLKEKINFPQHVLGDLQMISMCPSGNSLLKSLNSFGAKNCQLWVDFVHNLAPPKVSQASINWKTSKQQIERAGEIYLKTMRPTARAGIEVTVSYNPLWFGIPTVVYKALGEDYTKDPAYKDWGSPSQKPPDVTLFHELVHADDYFRGIFCGMGVHRGKGPTVVKIADLRAVGLDKFDNPNIYSENSYRDERNVKPRKYYKSKDELASPTIYYTKGDTKRIINAIYNEVW